MNQEINKSAEPTLEGWKEIATYLKRDVRTVMRWEKGEGLPIRRHLHNQRSSVYAVPSELNAWLAARTPQPIPQTVAWWRPRPAIGLAAAIFLLMFSFRGGPLAEMQAQAQTKAAPTVTQVYDDLDLWWDGSVSPDGKRFASTNWALGEIGIWDLATKHVTYIVHGNPGDYAIEPRWSPDGLRVAYSYCHSVPPTCELRIGNVAGGESVVAYRSDERSPEGVLDWSPDGKTILIALRLPDRKFAMGAYNVAASDVSVLRTFGTTGSIEARFSPDSRTVAYSAAEGGTRHLGLFSLADRTDVRIGNAEAEDRAPIWSKDGSQLLFVSNRSGRWDLWAHPLKEGRPVGDARMLRSEIGRVTRFAGWLDGQTLLYSKDSTPTGNFKTVSIDPANGTLIGEPKPTIPYFIGQHLLAKWSPDGQTIAFVAGGDDPKLYTYSAQSNKLRQIPTGQLSRPGLNVWYPAGDALALWTSQNPKGVATLYRASLSGELQEVYHDERARGSFASLSPDMSTFAYVRHLDAGDPTKPYSSICIYDLKHHKMLKEITAPPGAVVFQPQLSADSKWVFYVESKHASGERLVAAPVSAGEPRTLGAWDRGFLGRLAGSPDGSYLAYTWFPQEAANAGPGQPTGMKFFVIPTKGGKPQSLELPKYEGTTNFTWSPDGKQIGYITAENRAQWLALSNFLPQ